MITDDRDVFVAGHVSCRYDGHPRAELLKRLEDKVTFRILRYQYLMATHRAMQRRWDNELMRDTAGDGPVYHDGQYKTNIPQMLHNRLMIIRNISVEIRIIRLRIKDILMHHPEYRSNYGDIQYEADTINRL